MVELHNVKKTYKILGNCVNSLLDLLGEWLPKPNKLPKNYDAMRSMLKDLGMKAKAIHACENHCILYYEENEDLIECLVCKTVRFKLKATKDGPVLTNEPCKVLRYFNLDEKLNKMNYIPWISEEMMWHERAQVSSEYMCHPVDSYQWAQMKMKFPPFAAEGRNFWLGISTNGFNPHSVHTLSWSCWPVILVVYNLPPSMCMNYEFQMMTLLIPGRKYPGQDIDVFLRLLVNKLKNIWHQGVQAFDSLKREYFTLKATLMFGIHDFPAQDETRSTHLGYGSKIVYTNYRIFHKKRNPFRDKTLLGLEIHEHKSAPVRLTGAKSLEKLADVHYEPGKLVVRKTGKRKRYRSDEVEGDSELVTGALFKKCILWELESYCSLTIRNCVNVMHREKNFMEHIIYTIFDKDNKAIVAWNDRDKLKENKLHCGEWKEKKTKKGVEMVPLFVLSKKEKTDFCEILKDLKVPTGFSSNISNNVNMEQLNLSSLKSHDYHVIMGYLLPVLLQHAFPREKDLGTTLQQVSLYFRILCSKVVSREYLNQAKWMIAEAIDVKHPDWWVVDHTPRVMTADVDKVEIPGRDSFQDILEEELHLRKLLEQKRLPRSKK
ncbi:uncharacterized protein LOC113324575 [Papaver somniferum]|uniref:uncharacterized protein LOC113324575 n=1 Tax=Papaver somniferum TaxID=3469 RepID=UPI000E6FDD9F|nr:uncharacterized protein LOC113324575 [Papaver somniferum]